MPTQCKKNTRKRRLMARIHILKKEAALDEDSYRDLLQRLTGKRTSTRLNTSESYTVINYLERHTKKPHYPGRPNNTDSNPQLQKIEALLAEAKRPWAYATGMAKHMYNKQRLEFCDSTELSALITALINDAKKHGRALQ